MKSAQGGLAVLAAAAVVGCGGRSHTTTRVSSTRAASADHRFLARGWAIRFSYPGGFRRLRLQNNRNPKAPSFAFGIGQYDFIEADRFIGNEVPPVTSATISKAKAYLDRANARTFRRPMRAKVTTVAGAPGLTYPRVPDPTAPAGVTNRLTYLFVGNDEYELECHSSAARLAEMEAACNQMLHTLRVS